MQFVLPTFFFVVSLGPAWLLIESSLLGAEILHSANQCGCHTCPWRQPDGRTDIHSRTVITEESAERQRLKDLFHVLRVGLAILAPTNHKDGPLSIHTAPSQIARWAVWTVVEFLLTLQFVQPAHCKHLFHFFFNPLRGSQEREGAALDADRDITSLHIRFLQSSCKAAIPAALNGAIKNKWGLLEKLPLQRRLITVTPVFSRKKERGRRRLESQQSCLSKLEWFKAGADSDRLIDGKIPGLSEIVHH